MTGLTRGALHAPRSNELRLALPQEWTSHIASHAITRAFVEHVLADDWASIQRQADLLPYITNHCILCDRWPQDMRTHLVGDHGLPWSPITIRGVQLTALHGDQLCTKSVRAVHLCKVTHQGALIQLFAQPPDDAFVPPTMTDAKCQAGQPFPTLIMHPAATTCQLCQQMFDDFQNLRMHFTQQHQLANWDWSASRDAMAGTETCTRCLTLMESMDSLRQHIVIHGCPEFDSTLPTEPRPIPFDMRMAIESGDWTSLLTPERCAELTVHCQLCDTKYQRASDLQAHLGTEPSL